MNPDRYAELLATARPVVIESEEEHDHMLSIAEGLMEKGEQLGPEEEKLLALVVLLIEVFESTVEGSDPDEDDDEGPAEPPKPHETLRRLLEARGLELHDISDFFGNPQIAREALEGRRPISRGQAKQLGNYFRIPAKLFHP